MPTHSKHARVRRCIGEQLPPRAVYGKELVCLVRAALGDVGADQDGAEEDPELLRLQPHVNGGRDAGERVKRPVVDLLPSFSSFLYCFSLDCLNH